jgi:hypothetical protein
VALIPVEQERAERRFYVFTLELGQGLLQQLLMLSDFAIQFCVRELTGLPVLFICHLVKSVRALVTVFSPPAVAGAGRRAGHAPPCFPSPVACHRMCDDSGWRGRPEWLITDRRRAITVGGNGARR